MKTYISIKLVSAEPMKAERASGPFPKGAEGMRIVYEDGREAWCPQGVFVRTYRRIDTYNERGMGFSFALMLMKQGQRMARQGWRNQICRIEAGQHILFCRKEGGKTIAEPAALCEEDIVAEDWIIVKE